MGMVSCFYGALHADTSTCTWSFSPISIDPKERRKLATHAEGASSTIPQRKEVPGCDNVTQQRCLLNDTRFPARAWIIQDLDLAWPRWGAPAVRIERGAFLQDWFAIAATLPNGASHLARRQRGPGAYCCTRWWNQQRLSFQPGCHWWHLPGKYGFHVGTSQHRGGWPEFFAYSIDGAEGDALCTRRNQNSWCLKMCRLPADGLCHVWNTGPSKWTKLFAWPLGLGSYHPLDLDSPHLQPDLASKAGAVLERLMLGLWDYTYTYIVQ